MHVLVTWGSRLTEAGEIAAIIAAELRSRGFEVTAGPIDRIEGPEGLAAYDAAVIGGALYSSRWPASLRRFMNRHAAQLRRVPVWLFSSRPGDAGTIRGGDAIQRDLPPPRQVAVLAEKIGARDHATFAEHLERGPEESPAAWRAASGTAGATGEGRGDPDRIRAWAAEIAAELPTARPGPAVEHAAGTRARLALHAAMGWAVWTLCVALLRLMLTPWLAAALGVFVAAVVFGVVGWSYFRPRGARDPLPAAGGFVGVALVLHVIATTAPIVGPGMGQLASLTRTWLPMAVVFLTVRGIGELASTLPSHGRPRGGTRTGE